VYAAWHLHGACCLGISGRGARHREGDCRQGCQCARSSEKSSSGPRKPLKLIAYDLTLPVWRRLSYGSHKHQTDTRCTQYPTAASSSLKQNSFNSGQRFVNDVLRHRFLEAHVPCSPVQGLQLVAMHRTLGIGASPH